MGRIVRIFGFAGFGLAKNPDYPAHPVLFYTYFPLLSG